MMKLTTYKMFIAASPYPVEWEVEVSGGLETAIDKAIGEMQTSLKK